MSQEELILEIKKINDQNRERLEKMVRDHEAVKEMATWFVNQYQYALVALVELATFQDPEQLRAFDIGLPYEEHLEMAYDNMRQYARNSVDTLRANYANFPHLPSQE